MCRLIDHTLSQGCAWLVFPPALEQRFREDGWARRRRIILWGGVGAIVFCVALLAPHFFLLRDVFVQALWLHLAVFPVLCLGGMWVLARWRMPVLGEWLAMLCGMLASSLTLLLMLQSQSPWAMVSLTIFNVVVVYATAVGRFWPMVGLCIWVLALQAIGVYVKSDLMDPVAVSVSLLLFATMVFTVYGNHRLEHSERLAYLLNLQEAELQAELGRANDSLAQTARTDPLTQVANRRHFDDFLQQVWQQAQLQRSSVALLLLDVDHFKAYNDHYGHPAGDQCLRAVAQAVGSCLRRPSDLLARWGGEEFAVVMSGTSIEKAQQVAERVRQAVQAKGLAHVASRTEPVVTVSIGVTAVEPGAETSMQEFLRTADVCLYEAKSRGRNRIWARLTNPLGGVHTSHPSLAA
jgi:diguanylate cyclase (GGDEF)-like protein